mgnify:CR=1 FL=1
MDESGVINIKGVGYFYPVSKEFVFYRSECIEVELGNGVDDSFVYTPKFNEFEEVDDIFEYLTKYVEDRKLEKLDVCMCNLKTCIYSMNPETYELGEYLYGDINCVDYWVWNNETKKFDEVDSNSLTDEDFDRDWEDDEDEDENVEQEGEWEDEVERIREEEKRIREEEESLEITD